MNERDRKIVSIANTQIMAISARFELLLSLFNSKENIAAINAVAPNVFKMIHNSLLETIVMGLSRLCDPAVQGRNENLSLEKIRNLFSMEKILHQTLQSFETRINEQVAELKDYRNKRLGHNDFETLTEILHNSVSNAAINQSLVLMEQFLNAIYLHFDEPTHQILNPGFPIKDGPDRLMKILRDFSNSAHPQNEAHRAVL